jgi:hypothetical protein
MFTPFVIRLVTIYLISEVRISISKLNFKFVKTISFFKYHMNDLRCPEGCARETFECAVKDNLQTVFARNEIRRWNFNCISKILYSAIKTAGADGKDVLRQLLHKT